MTGNEPNPSTPVNTTSVPSRQGNLPWWVILLAFGILIAILAVAGLGLRNPAVTVGEKTPAFILTTFAGEEINTSELAGKVIVINFWASWCGPCADEAAELEQAWQHYKADGQVAFLGVDYLDTDSKALPYLEKYGITYPNGPDLKTRISAIFQIRGVPETYIVAPDGKLVSVKIGPFQSVEEIYQLVDQYLP